MPTCIICKEKWYYATHWEPEDDCACGNRLTADDVSELDPAEIDDMRDEWRERLREDEDE